MHSRAQKRLTNTNIPVKIINRAAKPEDEQTDIEYFDIDSEVTVDLSKVKVTRGGTFSIALNATRPGFYETTITAKPLQGGVAQLPVHLSCNGIAVGSFTWNGTNYESQSISKEIMIASKYTLIKFFFAQSGLELKDIRFKLTKTINNSVMF